MEQNKNSFTLLIILLIILLVILLKSGTSKIFIFAKHKSNKVINTWLILIQYG